SFVRFGVVRVCAGGRDVLSFGGFGVLRGFVGGRGVLSFGGFGVLRGCAGRRDVLSFGRFGVLRSFVGRRDVLSFGRFGVLRSFVGRSRLASSVRVRFVRGLRLCASVRFRGFGRGRGFARPGGGVALVRRRRVDGGRLPVVPIAERWVGRSVRHGACLK